MIKINNGDIMVSEKMEKALNGQLNAEVYSGYLYLSMAAYFEDEDLAGFANWMRVQAEEELEHGMKFYDYIIRRGASVTLTAIEGPQTEWESPLKAFEHVLEHEKMVTGLINDLVNLAIKKKTMLPTTSCNGLSKSKLKKKKMQWNYSLKLN